MIPDETKTKQTAGAYWLSHDLISKESYFKSSVVDMDVYRDGV